MMLYKPQDTFTTKLDPNYFAVINPYAERTVSVISQESKRILDYFANGANTKDIFSKFSSLDKEYLEDSIELLQDAQLLFSSPNPELEFFDGNRIDNWIHITNKCNLRCRYCYLHKSSQSMNYKTGKKVIDAIFRSANIHKKNTIKLKFSGGEALLGFNLIKKILQYALKKATKNGKKIESVVLSNGTILTEEMITWFKETDTHLMISLDGMEQHHDKQRLFPNGKGSFKLVFQNLKKVQESEISYNISTTISSENISGIPELTEYFMQNKVPFNFNFYRENVCSERDKGLRASNEEIIQKLKESYRIIERYLPESPLFDALGDHICLSEPKDKPCSVGSSYMVFDHNGNIAKCQMDISNIITTANSQDPLGDIQKDKKGIQNLSVKQKSSCESCVWRHFCAGGCPLLTYKKTGHYNKKSPFCEVYKAIIPEIIRIEGLRLLKYGG